MIKNKKKTTFKLDSTDASLQTFQEKIKKHQTRLYIVAVVVVCVSLGVFVYQNYKSRSELKAQEDMFQAVLWFEGGNYNQALSGDDSALGLLEISKKYCCTKAINLVNFYIGVSYLELKDFENAIIYLKKVSFKDFIMQARTLALIGDAYVEKYEYDTAVTYYEQAANYKPNKTLSPQYLEKAAIVYEANGNKPKALNCYEVIAKKYPSFDSSNITKHIERLK
jgi:tetratricopeptide (TPR) repeat protein